MPSSALGKAENIVENFESVSPCQSKKMISKKAAVASLFNQQNKIEQQNCSFCFLNQEFFSIFTFNATL